MIFHPGDKVRILRGVHAGAVMTIRKCTADEIWLEEMPGAQSMSAGNVEKV